MNVAGKILKYKMREDAAEKIKNSKQGSKNMDIRIEKAKTLKAKPDFIAEQLCAVFVEFVGYNGNAAAKTLLLHYFI